MKTPARTSPSLAVAVLAAIGLSLVAATGAHARTLDSGIVRLDGSAAHVTDKRDAFTDGANATGKRDPFTDGARVTDKRDPFLDGAHGAQPVDPWRDGA